MNLNLITSLDPIGYGYVGRFILKELTSAGVQVALFPLSYTLSVSDDPRNPVRLGLANASGTTRAHRASGSRRRGRSQNMSAAVSTPGFPIFELDRFDASEIHHLKQMDAILVCSKWAAGVVASNGISVPVVVAPLGVDRSIFHEAIGAGADKPRPISRTWPHGFCEQRQMGMAQGPRLPVAGVLQCLHAGRQHRAQAIEP